MFRRLRYLATRAAVIGEARNALRLAMDDDWDAAADIVQAIWRGHGADGVMTAVLAWLDTAISRQGIPHGSQVALSWRQPGGNAEGPGDVTDRIRWAGQLMAARAAMDKDAFKALAGSIPQEGTETGAYVLAVLNASATTCRMFAAGGRS